MSIDSAVAFEVNPLGGKSESRESDTLSDIEQISDETRERIETFLEAYPSFTRYFFELKHRMNRVVKCFFKENDLDSLLSPTEIHLLSSRISEHHPPGPANFDMSYYMHSHPFSEYFRHLIHVAYANGKNDFSLSVGGGGVSCLMRDFPTYADAMLKLTVDGYVGDKAFAYLRNADVHVLGSVDCEAANHVKNLHLLIDGDASDDFGNYAKYSYLNVQGRVMVWRFAKGASHTVFSVNSLISAWDLNSGQSVPENASSLANRLKSTEKKPTDCIFNVCDEASYEALMQVYHMEGRNTINLVRT